MFHEASVIAPKEVFVVSAESIAMQHSFPAVFQGKLERAGARRQVFPELRL